MNVTMSIDATPGGPWRGQLTPACAEAGEVPRRIATHAAAHCSAVTSIFCIMAAITRRALAWLGSVSNSISCLGTHLPRDRSDLSANRIAGRSRRHRRTGVERGGLFGLVVEPPERGDALEVGISGFLFGMSR